VTPTNSSHSEKLPLPYCQVKSLLIVIQTKFWNKLGAPICLSDCLMDWASRYVLSWKVSVSMDDDFCVNALKRVPCANIMHL